MKQENEQNLNTTETKETAESVEEKIAQTGYPDINKANTKMIVIASLVVIIILFLLSVFFPTPSTMDATTEGATTNVNSETSTTEIEVSSTDSARIAAESAKTDTTNDNTLPAMGQVQTSVVPEVFSMHRLTEAAPGFIEINGKTYYLREGKTPFTGWLKIDDICYYIQDDGTIAKGWQEIDHKTYYFAEDGSLLTCQWIEDRYVGSSGAMYVNSLTPDGIYVGKDGYEDTSMGKDGSTDGLTDLKDELENMLAGYSGTWSVYVKDIANKEYLTINNTQMFSASLIKLYCAAAAYDLMEKGTMEETERINSLMVQMISISDNDAFSLMVTECSGCNSQVAGRPVIQEYIDSEGYVDTTLTSMLLPTKYKAPSSPGRNYTTVEDCGLLLEKIYKGKCVSPESSKKFLDLLLNQSHINKIPAGLPDGTKCANKTGDTDEFQHDAAIVYSPGGDYIITVMSTDCGAAITNTREISEVVYDYFN